MRVSTNESDPGYPNFQRLYGGPDKILVFLDGNEIDEVETADEEEGFLIRAKTNDEGHVYVIPGTDEIARETLTGQVEVRLVPKD